MTDPLCRLEEEGTIHQLLSTPNTKAHEMKGTIWQWTKDISPVPCYLLVLHAVTDMFHSESRDYQCFPTPSTKAGRGTEVRNHTQQVLPTEN